MITVQDHKYTIRKITDEGGKTKCIEHTVTLSSGRTLQFSERNVFDFGRVINPMYAVAEGLEPGGLCNIRDGMQVWEDFARDKYRLPDSRVVESDEAIEWALSTISPGLPDGYSVESVSIEPLFGLPGDQVERIVLHFPDAECMGPWFDSQYCVSPEQATEIARRNHAYYLLRPLQIETAGWYVVRPLDADDIAAMSYLWQHGYYASSGIGMDTDEDITEMQRIDREEASLELACEEGLLPGAMPADI